MGASKSSKYFAENEESRKKKNAYNKEYHSTPQRRRYRSELNKINRKNGKKGDGKDVSHQADGTVKMENESANRARNGKGGRKRLG
jgi:hypothetical protein